MLRQILDLEGERARVVVIVHQQIKHRRGLQVCEVAGPVRHGTVGHFEQHFESGPGFGIERDDDGAEEIDELDGAFDAAADAEEMPAGAAGHVFQLDAAQGGEGGDAAVQDGKRIAGGNITPGDGIGAGATAPNWLTMRSRSLERRSRTWAAARVARFRLDVQAVAALLFEDEGEDLLFEIARAVEVALRVIFRQTREWRFQRLVELHAAIPSPALPEAPASPVRRTRMQRRMRAQVFAAFGVAAEPEEVVGGAAGKVGGDAAVELNGQVARAAAG